MAEMTEEVLTGLLDGLIKDAKAFRDSDLMPDCTRAQEYYDGIMKDTPADANRSQLVSRDVRAAITKVLPSIVRTILGNDKVVEYTPVAEGDEASCEQATIYVNNIVLPESGGNDAIIDSINNALLLRNGVLKWWFEEKASITESLHTGLDQPTYDQLVADDSVQILEKTERQEQIEGTDPQSGQSIVSMEAVYDCRIRRQIKKRSVKVNSVPRDQFLISPDALSIETAQLVGDDTRRTRSELISLGYDRDQIMGLATSQQPDDEDFERRQDLINQTDTQSKAMEEVDYYDLYVRVDFDDDGIAELRHICIAGAIKGENILVNDVCDDVPMDDIVCRRRPHQWEGQSLFDDIWDLQRVKTVLLRATADNLYWQNNLQPIVQLSAVKNPESVTERNFGQPILLKDGVSAADAISYAQVPAYAQESFQMLSYMDDVITDRTGISDAASGLAPDALQNMTAKASAMIEQAGIGQIEQIVRTIAGGGLKRMFKGVLKLIVQHQDKPRTVRLRDKWVTFDPRSWNADMDATVNTGLGAGTRERDAMMMQQVIGLQEKILASMGPDNPYVKPDNLYNAIEKFTESVGLHSPDLYFTKPDPQEVQQKLEALKNKPDPEKQKADAAMQLEQVKGQNAAQIEQIKGQISIQTTQAKMTADTSKEAAQRDADLQVKLAEMEKNAQSEAQKQQLEREKLAEDSRQKQLDRDQQLQIEMMRLSSQNESQQQKLAANERSKAHDSKAKQNELLIMAGKTPEPEGPQSGDISKLLEGLIHAHTAPKRIVRDPQTGRAVGVEVAQ